MNKKNISYLLILLFISLSFITNKVDLTHQPQWKNIKPQLKILSDYQLVWQDNFDGKKLNEAFWSYRSLGKRRDGINHKDAISLNNGILSITTTKKDNNFFTAMIDSRYKVETTYGYFECRVKLQQSVGHWSSFWLQKKRGIEIDIFEYLVRQKQYVNQAIHWGIYEKKYYSGYHANKLQIKGISKNWHIFSLLWTKSEYSFYVDGKKVWKINKNISHRNHYIIFGLEIGRWAGKIENATLPDSFKIDYVRIFKKIP